MSYSTGSVSAEKNTSHLGFVVVGIAKRSSQRVRRVDGSAKRMKTSMVTITNTASLNVVAVGSDGPRARSASA